MSYSRYDPTLVARPLRKDERGYWTISLPDDVGGWNREVRDETWGYLEKIVGKRMNMDMMRLMITGWMKWGNRKYEARCICNGLSV